MSQQPAGILKGKQGTTINDDNRAVKTGLFSNIILFPDCIGLYRRGITKITKNRTSYNIKSVQSRSIFYKTSIRARLCMDFRTILKFRFHSRCISIENANIFNIF